MSNREGLRKEGRKEIVQGEVVLKDQDVGMTVKELKVQGLVRSDLMTETIVHHEETPQGRSPLQEEGEAVIEIEKITIGIDETVIGIPNQTGTKKIQDHLGIGMTGVDTEP